MYTLYQFLIIAYHFTLQTFYIVTAGIYCPENIPHGKARKFLDAGQAGRWEIGFRCDDGYRRHRGVDNVECVAGRVITWQERFGIDVSRLCIPTGEE